jgi:hypothetical protein
MRRREFITLLDGTAGFALDAVAWIYGHDAAEVADGAARRPAA